MNRDQFIQRMSELGYSPEEAQNQIRLSKDRSDLVLRRYNFVPAGNGSYEIWISDERDRFFRAREGGTEFLGTLSDAYDYVFDWARD